MKISIVTPSYNSQNYIEQTIQSIMNQSYKNFEHIVIDGNSTDGTIKILKKYPHLQWISESDKGQADAINKGFQLASGDILAWQNADDLYFPETFQLVVDFFKDNPDIDVIYGGYQIIGDKGEVLCKVDPMNWNLWLFSHGRSVPLQPTVFWRRKVYEGVGILDINLHYCMDIDFFCRACKNNFKFAKVNQLLGQFRLYENSKTGQKKNLKNIYKERKQVFRENFTYSLFDIFIYEVFYWRGKIARFIKINLDAINSIK